METNLIQELPNTKDELFHLWHFSNTSATRATWKNQTHQKFWFGKDNFCRSKSGWSVVLFYYCMWKLTSYTLFSWMKDKLSSFELWSQKVPTQVH